MIYLAANLRTVEPLVFDEITKAFRLYDITYSLIEGTNNIWARDYMPIQTASGFTKFVYKTCTDRFPKQMVTSSECWSNIEHESSPIVLDGGNAVQSDKVVIMTDAVVRDNPREGHLTDKLEKIFGKEVVIIPREPGDDLGHSDGIVKFLKSRLLLVNNYLEGGGNGRRYLEKVIAIFESHNLQTFLFPYGYRPQLQPTEKEARETLPWMDDFNPCVGYFINALEVASLILLPTFNIHEDTVAIQAAQIYFPEHDVVPIQCRNLAWAGGAIHCVTAEGPD